MDLTIDVPVAFKGSRTKGFCGVYNGIGGSDEYYPENTQYKFIEYYRYATCTKRMYTSSWIHACLLGDHDYIKLLKKIQVKLICKDIQSPKSGFIECRNEV